MPDWINFEAGSLAAFLFLIFLFLDSKRRANIKAEIKAETGNTLTKNLISAVESTKKDVADIKLHNVKNDGKLEKIDYALHNGIVDKLDKLIESKERTDSSQWEHINKNSNKISALEATQK